VTGFNNYLNKYCLSLYFSHARLKWSVKKSNGALTPLLLVDKAELLRI
ncbi:MAG: hypothetical protein ACI8WB_003035, partial [Phenylobacterium sp.]